MNIRIGDTSDTLGVVLASSLLSCGRSASFLVSEIPREEFVTTELLLKDLSLGR